MEGGDAEGALRSGVNKELISFKGITQDTQVVSLGPYLPLAHLGENHTPNCWHIYSIMEKCLVQAGGGGAPSPQELQAGGPARESIPSPAPSPRPYQPHVLMINSNSLQSQSLYRPGRDRGPEPRTGAKAFPQDAHGREEPLVGQRAPLPGKAWYSCSRRLHASALRFRRLTVVSFLSS